MRDKYPTKTIHLVGDMQKATARLLIDQAPVDPMQPIQVTIGEKKDTRSLDQNAKFHALCQDVSEQAEWMGKKLSMEAWKVLFVSGHSVATGVGAEVVPGLENEFVNIRESTAKMSKSRLSSLMEYCLAWCADNGIKLRAEA